eukprot:1310992-Pyramimonas_sp.AAC.1
MRKKSLRQSAWGTWLHDPSAAPNLTAKRLAAVVDRALVRGQPFHRDPQIPGDDRAPWRVAPFAAADLRRRPDDLLLQPARVLQRRRRRGVALHGELQKRPSSSSR